jgi:hypothetical protein
LDDKGQKALLKFIADYDKKIQKRYSVEEISKYIDRDINLLSGKKPSATILKTYYDLDTSVERTMVLLKKFMTDRVRITKNGIRYISPKEQTLRRGAGSISTIFEDRRAKDISKLYSQLKVDEILRMQILENKKLSQTSKLSKLFNLNKLRESKINELKKLTKSISSDAFRKEKIISTKGKSEESFFKIDFTGLKPTV